MNTNGLYKPLVAFFEQVISEGFADKALRSVYYIAESPEDALNYIKNYHDENAYVKYGK